ncbi:hypothetical protein [Rathayibacter sp. VKM Ac-2630]|uniref:hypothetical protein n=1 Tax=Rathayibacter sp. VKM Ac-2630 TaxID=1938617 RepID=UPI0009816FDD|nr:hypothetical protein [Rathayibacter sp. VKM Ac-2630]OOB90284.1 hypothetical protein B0T42_12340 [Rathayibacter sp. VKM Ac-2630]
MRLAPHSAKIATGDGRVEVAPDQITLDRAGSAIAIRGDEVRVERGGARVTLRDDEIRVERGDSRVVVGASVEVRNAGGAYVLMDGPNVRLKQKTGPGLELRDGDAYLTDLPTS